MLILHFEVRYKIRNLILLILLNTKQQQQNFPHSDPECNLIGVVSLTFNIGSQFKFEWAQYTAAISLDVSLHEHIPRND